MVEKPRSLLHDAAQTVAVYVLWLALAALLLFVVLQAREAVTALFRVITLNRWIVGAVDRFSLFLLGLIALIVILVEENYLREGASEGKLVKRFLTLLAAHVLAYGLFFGLERLSLYLIERSLMS